MPRCEEDVVSGLGSRWARASPPLTGLEDAAGRLPGKEDEMSKRTAVFRRVRRVVPVAGQGGVSEPMTRLYVVCSSLWPVELTDDQKERLLITRGRSPTKIRADIWRRYLVRERHPANGSEDSTG